MAHMDYSKLMGLCSNRDWDSIKNDLSSALKKTPDNPELLCLSAHFAMRQGHLSIAQWLINKSIALDAEYQPAFAELTLLKFIHNDQTFLMHDLSVTLLESVPENHPLHLLNIFSLILNEKKLLSDLNLDRFNGLSYFKDEIIRFIKFNQDSQFDENDNISLTFGPKTFKLIHELIDQKDLLLAHIISQCIGLLSPLNPDIFAASGLSYLALNKLDLAGLQFSEALFRGTSFEKEISHKLFIVNCRQRTFHDAITIGLALERQHLLSTYNELMLIDIYMQLGTYKKEAERRLKKLSISIRPESDGYPYFDTLYQKNIYFNSKEKQTEVVSYLKNKTDDSHCKAAYLYFYAEILKIPHPEEAKLIAKRAIAANPFHIDAKLWLDENEPQNTTTEFLSLFVSREGEGKVWPSPSEEALIQLIFNGEESPKNAWTKFQEDFPLGHLTAGAYRLLPSLYKKLSSHQIDSGITKGIWKKSFFENSYRLSLALPFFDALDKKNIHFVLLKGIANAITLYDDLGSRAMSDIDVYIDPSDISEAHELLTNLGWQTKDIPNSPRLRFQYASTYKHAGGGNIDLHWRLSEDFSCDYFDIKDFMPLNKVSLHGRHWAILSPTINLMLTILHGVAWNHLSPSRWVVDTKLILDQDYENINWESILKLTEKYLCRAPFIAGLKYFFSLDLNMKPPKLLKGLLKQDDSDSPLMRIRFRSKSHISDFEEAYATYQTWQKKFSLSEHDILIVCGKDKVSSIEKGCIKHDILWAPYFEPDTIIKELDITMSHFNLVAIDANYSCLIRLYCKF